MKKINLTTILSIVIISLSISVIFVYAEWNPPSASPPNNNAPSPLTESLQGEIKAGGLAIGQNLSDAQLGFAVVNGKVGIGTVSPNARLEIDGTLRLSNSSPSDNTCSSLSDVGRISYWKETTGCVANGSCFPSDYYTNGGYGATSQYAKKYKTYLTFCQQSGPSSIEFNWIGTREWTEGTYKNSSCTQSFVDYSTCQ